MNLQHQFVAIQTIILRESRRVIRIWPQTILPAAITTILYFIIFGHIIGKKVGMMSGFPYILYIAPGLIMMQMITNAYNSTASSFFSAKFQRQIEELLVAPISSIALILGFLINGLIRGVVVASIVTLIALAFTHLHIRHPIVVIGVSICSASLFSLLGLINGIYARKFDDVYIIPTFILTPLIYLGGVFYSIALLPKSWQYITFINPITYIINAFRFGILGVSDLNIVVTFIFLCLFIIILFIFALYLIKTSKGLRF